jgi:4'-phosphopantetheinyl transferase EntD
MPFTNDVIETVLPEAASAEAFSDLPEPAMYPSEAAVVATAVAERRREFATVRHCAREALRRLGMPPAAIVPGADRAPRWPAGVVGSMTHCPGYRAAAVARADELLAVGIDAEPHAGLPPDVVSLVAGRDERQRLEALARQEPELHWDRILFCAKEAFYKAWFPLTRRPLEFDEAVASPSADGSFEAGLASSGRNRFSGRWTVADGIVVAAVALGRKTG